MARRYFLQQPFDSESVRLVGAEARHLSRVMRLLPGDVVTLFDGKGSEGEARIESIDAGVVELTILSRAEVSDRPLIELTLATAVPKGERFDWLVEKAVELGVCRLIPLISSRTVVHPGASKLERLRRTIIEASKQCGRSRLMELAEPVRWADFLAHEFTAGQAFWIADPRGDMPQAVARSFPKRLVVAIGPEGGLAASEVEQGIDAGGTLVAVGQTVLRIETAAIAFAALAAAQLDCA